MVVLATPTMAPAAARDHSNGGDGGSSGNSNDRSSGDGGSEFIAKFFGSSMENNEDKRVETVGDHEYVNLKNDNGDTILHLAAANKQTEQSRPTRAPLTHAAQSRSVPSFVCLVARPDGTIQRSPASGSSWRGAAQRLRPSVAGPSHQLAANLSSNTFAAAAGRLLWANAAASRAMGKPGGARGLWKGGHGRRKRRRWAFARGIGARSQNRLISPAMLLFLHRSWRTYLLSMIFGGGLEGRRRWCDFDFMKFSSIAYRCRASGDSLVYAPHSGGGGGGGIGGIWRFRRLVEARRAQRKTCPLGSHHPHRWRRHLR
ncbi:hypothetical protein NL676_033780 [Syzygium grande]|nr:hypothetical protein NL676_033780 [Syzygium grande]